MVTAKMGELFPVGCVPVLPGDTFQHSTSALVRMAPLNTPVMHPVQVRLHHFFVPNRITWPESENGGWEQFITGGPDGNNSASPPTVNTDNNKKSMLSFLGLPPTELTQAPVNALALRAANMTINEYYRDQDIIAERALNDNTLANIAWEKDYFSTARPWAQKGSAVTLPIGTQAPIRAPTTSGTDTLGVFDDNAGASRAMLPVTDTSVIPGVAPAAADLYADLAAVTQLSINDFRAGFSLQRYQEARARYGSRFTEYLRYCGITPSDARLQRPEFLGGGSTRLNFSEVLQTTPASEAGTAGVGDLYGHGIAGVRSNAYRKFFEEHGYVISFMSIRPKTLYMNGAHREWLKTTKEDYFQKELANLGQQEILKGELYMDTGSRLQTFGFQDRYDEYRQHWSQVSGDFRDTLSSWHLARILDSNVALNPSFIDCQPKQDIFQVTTGDNCWIMVNHKIVARRMVPKRANPRII